MTIKLEKTYQNDSTYYIDVSVLVDERPINALSGKIYLTGGDRVAINTGKSIFPMWTLSPTQTKLGEDQIQIEFEGVLPGGFSGLIKNDKEQNLPGNVFTIALNKTDLENISNLKFRSENVVAYLNDGLGTAVDIEDTFSDVLLEDFAYDASIVSDDTPPEQFQVYVADGWGEYLGQKVLVFETYDRGSGMYLYKKIVGEKTSIQTTVTSPAPVSLRELRKGVTIRAIDNEGNWRDSVVPTSYSSKIPTDGLILLGGIFGIIVIWLLLIMAFRKKGNL